MTFSIVIPTVGRTSLHDLLASLAACAGPRPRRIVVVDDRPVADPPIRCDERAGWTADLVEVRRSGGRGPAAARNVGRRGTGSTWVVFLDDDVRVTPTWLVDLDRDLSCAATVAGVQGRITVPLPADRRPTDWERGTTGLATARWITADIAYRSAVLDAVRGFDERFPRAFREDADLALRVQDAGHRIVVGTRQTVHPVRPARWDASLRQQRGNADDALMRRVHGRRWHVRAEAAVGRRPRHLVTTALGAAAVASGAAGRRRVAGAAALGWAAATARFAAERIAPGPRDRAEIVRMAVTSAAIPPAAVAHWLRGTWRHRHARPWAEAAPRAIEAVLFDRDGTLVRDVPYNGDPALVDPMPGADKAVLRLREAGLRVGVVSNQSGIARGLLTAADVAAVNARVDDLVGPLDTWQVCPHGPDDACACRKPAPGLIQRAAQALGVPVQRCAVVGDIGADVAAGIAAGAALTVLVPTPVTRRDEVDDAPLVCPDLAAAVDEILQRSAA